MISGPPAPTPHSRTLAEALHKAAQSAHGVTFVDVREQEHSLLWSQVLDRALKAAGALTALGIRPQDRVAIVLPTGPAFLDAFFGAVLAGAVPVPLYPPVRLGKVDEYHRATARMLKASGARIVVSDAKISLLLGPSVRAAKPDLGLHRADALLSGTPFEATSNEDDLALVQFSSGSTVDPKPVALSNANLLSQVATLKALMPEEEGLRPLGVSWLPLYHDMGLIGCLLEAVYYPGPLVLIPPEVFLARPALWLRALSRHRGTTSPAPNFAYGLCAKRIRDEDLEGVDLSAWRYALNGAEPVSASVMRRFIERFGRFGFREDAFFPVYGLSEASLAVTWPQRRTTPRALQVEESTRELVCVGAPIPGVQLDLREGRIFVKGPSVMTGYLDQPEATAKALHDGWLDTGDLGVIDGGELFITGRARDLVIIRGANHAPQEFEDCLEHVDGVRTGCAVALGFVPDGADGEELLLLAEHTGDPQGLEERIRAAIIERTGIRPHTVKLLQPGTLPRTSSGKLRRQEALRQFTNGTLRPPKKVGAFGVALEIARAQFGSAQAEPEG